MKLSLLLLNMNEGGRRIEDAEVIGRYQTAVLLLLTHTAAKYGLAVEPIGEFTIGALPDSGELFWLEIADEDYNIISKATYLDCIQSDRVQPQPSEVAELLNGFCTQYGMGIRYKVPETV